MKRLAKSRPYGRGLKVKRLANASLFEHWCALAALLVALVWVAGGSSGAVWTSDEGAILFQAVGAADGVWEFENPLPEIDVEGTRFPLTLTKIQEDGDYLVLAKHTVFTRMVGSVYLSGAGYLGTLSLIVLCGAFAALGTARLAGLFDPVAAKPALWLVGLSPIVMNSYMVWGHAPAAAMTAWASFFLVKWIRGGSVGHLVGFAVFLPAAQMIRSEATLFGIAIFLSLAVAGLVAKNRRTIEAAVAALVVVPGAFLVDKLLAFEHVGNATGTSANLFNGVAGRLQGFGWTWFSTSIHAADQRPGIALSALGVLAAGFFLRKGESLLSLSLAGLAFVLAAVTPFISGPTSIPGIVMAFPVLFFVFVAAEGVSFGYEERILALAAVLFGGGVLLTQYAVGGGGEWGWRYTAVGMPLALALAGRPLHGLLTSDNKARRLVTCLCLAAAAATCLQGVVSFGQSRTFVADYQEQLDAFLAASDATDAPLVTTIEPLGRYDWEAAQDGAWLTVRPEDMPLIVERLDASSIERFVVVTTPDEAGVMSLAPPGQVPETIMLGGLPTSVWVAGD